MSKHKNSLKKSVIANTDKPCLVCGKPGGYLCRDVAEIATETQYREVVPIEDFRSYCIGCARDAVHKTIWFDAVEVESCFVLMDDMFFVLPDEQLYNYGEVLIKMLANVYDYERANSPHNISLGIGSIALFNYDMAYKLVELGRAEWVVM